MNMKLLIQLNNGKHSVVQLVLSCHDDDTTDGEPIVIGTTTRNSVYNKGI